LGLNSAVAAAMKGFSVVGYHDDAALVARLNKGEPQVVEPQLSEAMAQCRDQLAFSAELSSLALCDLVYISVDVPTDEGGESDLAPVEKIIADTIGVMHKDALLIVLCQVPPGFTRTIDWPEGQLFYQVETLIFGRAMERALYPERFILGCINPGNALNIRLLSFLEAFECPILPMRYESAELAKIAINMCLVAAVSTANTLAEICEHIGANWAEIVPALRLDRRIGEHAYLKPGLGIAGGNLERDIVTVLRFAETFETDAGVVAAWLENSKHRKDWTWTILNSLVLATQPQAKIAMLGLTYKENTHSVKNSPALALIERLKGNYITVYDPAAKVDAVSHGIVRKDNAVAAIEQADVLLVMTPWAEFESITADVVAVSMHGRVVIDPYRILPGDKLVQLGFYYATLGEPVCEPA
jgi:UDPglucose 6-dehydrogenase